MSVPVVLLAGGLGTRLREETDVKPKPMVEVGGHPILWHIMKSYAAHGFDEFVVCLGYKGESIKDFFLNYRSRQGGVSVDLASAASTCTTPAPAKAGRSTCWRPDSTP
jgi:glucose-1-phosphate cytidylyltransferase